ncbi:hypothetical protein M0802_009366 [Mischocyttarus mexicanus]|nr:hypothetical protein M0802_009366 [Mischocyttarus mexicanus]
MEDGRKEFGMGLFSSQRGSYDKWLLPKSRLFSRQAKEISQTAMGGSGDDGDGGSGLWWDHYKLRDENEEDEEEEEEIYYRS